MKSAETIETLGDLYIRSCRWRASETLFADEHEAIGADRALNLSASLARVFALLGARKGEVVAFLAKCSARHAIGWFAGPLGGQIVCNLHLRETPERIAEALGWLDAKILVHDAEVSDLARQVVACSGQGCKRISLGRRGDAAAGWEDIVAHVDDTGDARERPSPSDLAAIILSSGSTGKPKGVVHTQRSLVEAAKGGQYAFGGLSRHDAALLYMQPSFAGWPIIVLPCVGAKAKVVFGGRFTPDSFLDAVERERITLAPLVPTMWRMVFEQNLTHRNLSSIRMATIAGEPPAPSDIASLHSKICRRLASLYLSAEGLTASGVVAFTEDLLRPGKAAATGLPAPGVDVRIIDPSGGFADELPRGIEGEIAVSGLSMAVGYWKDADLTSERFSNGWWRSGDLGYVDAEGDIRVTGRLDNIINSGGIKVSGEEIERALLAHPAVTQCAVVGVADAQFGQRVEAWVIPSEPALSERELEAFCREQVGLASFKLPRKFHIVPELPTGPTGKLYRRGLRHDT